MALQTVVSRRTSSSPKAFLALEVVDVDDRDHPACRDHRRAHVGEGHLGARHRVAADLAAVHRHADALADHPPIELVLPHLEGRDVVAAQAMLVEVGRRGDAPGLVEPADREIAGGKDLAQLVADQIDDRVQVELRHQALLMLLITASSALRWRSASKLWDVLQRQAEAGRNRRDQLDVALAEGVLALVADADQAGGLLAAHQGRIDEGVVDRRPADHLGLDAVLGLNADISASVPNTAACRVRSTTRQCRAAALGLRGRAVAFTVVEEVGIGDDAARGVVQGDADDARR
jgi:hypothetical protein